MDCPNGVSTSLTTPRRSLPSVGAEGALLLHCVRRFVGSETEEDPCSLISRVPDWSFFFRLASDHGVAPLVFQFIHEADSNALLEPYSGASTQPLENARQSLVLTAELLAVLDLFDLHSIPALTFKGPALAAELYGNLGLRDFCDIDILVRRDDVQRAKKALLAHGYRTDLPTRPAEESAYLKSRYELHFTAQNGSFVEIHQAFLAPFFSFPLDYQALWRRLEWRPFCGRKILALAPEDLLLALSAHGTKHLWHRLVWICDIARFLVVFGPDLDWPQITKRASSLGARRMVRIGILLAHRLLGAPVPDEVLKQAQEDATALRLARNVEQSLFAQEISPPSDMHSHRFFLQARERPRDKFIYCTHLAFMPTEEDHAVFPLPSFLYPLYYPLHAVRVFRKFGLVSMKSSVRDWKQRSRSTRSVKTKRLPSATWHR